MADPVVHITAGLPDSGTGNITTLGQTLLDGANVTVGAIADAVVAAGASGTIGAKLRAISRDVGSNVGTGVVLGAAVAASSIPVVQATCATGTQSIVASSATDVTVLASNAARRGGAVFNDSTQILFLLLSNTTSSATVYTVQLASNGYYEIPFGYTGVLRGIWASANGNARVTELT